MELEQVFAAADAELSRVMELKEAALSATEGQAERLAQALAGRSVPFGVASAERAAMDAEATWLAALPKACSRIVSILERAKPFYVVAVGEPAIEEPRRKGLFGFLPRKKAEQKDEPSGPSPAVAQAAFAGRETRLSAAFAMVDEAIERTTARRAMLDELAFRFQEAALAAAGDAVSPDAAARAAYSAEEAATLLTDHSSALALHARVLEAVDRTPQGAEDDVASAAEALLDRLMEEELAA